MSESIVAVSIRYADALFELAQEQGALDAVEKDVAKVAEALRQQDFADWLFDARVPAARKSERIAELVRPFHALTKSFVQLVQQKRRERVLLGLAPAFRRRLLASRGEVEGRVESARPLDAAELAELAAHLTKLIGRKVLLENRVVPELLGGVRVLVAGRLVEQSVVGRLEGLRRRLSQSRMLSAGR